MSDRSDLSSAKGLSIKQLRELTVCKGVHNTLASLKSCSICGSARGKRLRAQMNKPILARVDRGCYDLPRVKIEVLGGVVIYEIEGDVIVELIDHDLERVGK